MKIVKLMENITKGKIDSETHIKVDVGTEIVYKFDDQLGKCFFEDVHGNRVDIMEYFNCDFEPVITHINKDIWDTVDEELNKDVSESSNIRKTIGSSNEGSGKFPKFTIEMVKAFLAGKSDLVRSENGKGYEFVLKNNMQGKYKFHEDGSLEYISFYDRDLKNYAFDENQSVGFYNSADGYYDAAISIIKDYNKRFEKLYDYGSMDKNTESFGYYQDAIIKTLLAFSCECYLKSLLLNQGKTIKDLKSLSHGLVDLYHALDNDTFSDVFQDMEKNGYDIKKYVSPNIPYDNPDLTEKFMIELGMVDDAFVDARYSAENDKNTNYEFLYRFATSLRNVAGNRIKTRSPFDDGVHIKK